MSERRDDRAEIALLQQELAAHRQALRAGQAELAEAQRSLALARDRYRDLYEFAPIAYMTLDASGKILEINLTGTTLLEETRSVIEGRLLLLWVSAGHRPVLRDHLRRGRNRPHERVCTELELVRRSSEKSLGFFELCSESYRSPKGEIEHRAALVDLRDRRRAEAMRQRSLESQAASEAKDRFLAMLSHELRNPLTPIVTALDILAATPDIPAEARKLLGVIERNVRLQTKLVDDLLDSARIARGKLRLTLEETDLHALLAEIADAFAHEPSARGHTITADLRAGDARVRGDRERLHQVFTNLVKNACEHTPRGSTVEIATRSDGERLRVLVSDDGPGLEQEQRDQLFSAFEQAAVPGTTHGSLGLGLWIARGLVQAHGGSIAARARQPHGTTFEVALPLASERPAAGEASCADEPAPREHSGARILIVEDNRDAADMLQALLDALGHETTVAYEGGTAVDVARRFAPDLVLCDIGLPGMDGYEVARAIGSAMADERPYLVAVSGYGRPEDVRRALDAGFDAYATKPINAAKLRDVLARRGGRAH